MEILEVSQGSTDWLALRQSKITGTDCPIILNSSPFKTKMELWEQKLGIKKPDELNERMKRGSLLEEPARLMLNKFVEIDFKPAVVISERHPFMMASLDGLSECGRYMCEIKCPSIRSHEEAINGVISPYYIDQMQHCLLVTGCDICYYFSYNPDHKEHVFAIEPIYPDLIKQAEIIEKEQEFYINMCTMNPPEEWKFKEKK